MEEYLQLRGGLTIKLCDETPRIEKSLYDRSELHCHDAQGRCTALDKSAVAEAYIATNQLECFNKMLYSPDGPISDDQAVHELTQTLRELGYRNNLPTAISEILQDVKALSYRPGMPEPKPGMIPFADGELDITSTPWVYHRGRKTVTPYRFPMSFPHEYSDCPTWEKFLSELLSADDIPTLQTFLGYAMTPSTEAQSLIVLKGQAGSGKSQIVPVVKKIWDSGYAAIHLHRLLDKYGFVPIINRLILIDDDLSQKWIEDTALLKKLVSADGEIPVEMKNKDIFNYQTFSKLVACTNFELQALHDDSEGFARRILPIDVIGRRHEPGESIGQRIADTESEGVLFWILEGLHQWQISHTIPISNRTKANQRKLITDRDSLHSFCYSCLQPDPTSSLSTEELYKSYVMYCDREELKPIRGVYNLKGFGYEIGKILPRLGYESGRIGTTVRKKGWKCIKLREEAEKNAQEAH